MTSTPLSPTPRTRLRRGRDRAATDRTALYEILDEGLICHLGVLINGTPVVLPTGYGRSGDTLYLHGSTGSASLATGAEVCVTVTHLDGLVLARSTFNHSMNYRSAIVYGTPRVVTDPDEKLAGLRTITENLAPGQWDALRAPTRKELAATKVLALSLEEASVKTRQGPPSDDDADYELDIWAGVRPIRQTYGPLEPDPRLRPGIPVPAHLAG
ncbi:pyridoxamine 5'-phosphate oxidase family protein [Actinomadura hibisca]|uniref:pyridoxamine 5'-phosphate oxidase family protein n=1 Tax=Actinomadura hibisca TaxID=68565 RepID=UPI00082BC43B|nr:pyridoxamine 5'-phosphate oxidase family protein [Actinomadura hibisca]